jgi:hypothetical protein
VGKLVLSSVRRENIKLGTALGKIEKQQLFNVLKQFFNTSQVLTSFVKK